MNGVKIMSKNYDFTFAQREEGFDDHIEHSIRGYTNLLEDIISLSRNFVEDISNMFSKVIEMSRTFQELF